MDRVHWLLEPTGGKMQFRILSHAGLEIVGSGKSLVCDPWLVGSAYWRSWWNYPPVSPGLVASLKPDFIYLTHIHWDHFQGASLRRFPTSTRILIPKSPCLRMRDDLHYLGFHNIQELKHGETVEIEPGFTLTCYHFGIFLDSAIVVEHAGTVLLNANDTKVMGLPLRQIIGNHPAIDFVLRSHSSANSRACCQIIDDAKQVVDDQTRYARDFAAFARAVGATYAIPFASNHCHLHKDTYPFNSLVTTPSMVRDFFEQHDIRHPILKVMLSGDSWSREGGFRIADNDWFDRRDELLQAYQASKSNTLNAFYAMEGKATVSFEQVEQYFKRLFKVMPYLLRRLFKDRPVLYVITTGTTRLLYEVDLFHRTVRERQSCDDRRNPIQIHLPAYIFKCCMERDLFSQMPISKRLKYRITSSNRKYIARLQVLFALYEARMLPLRGMLNGRYVEALFSRWREWILYFQIVFGLLVTHSFNMQNLQEHILDSTRKKTWKAAPS